MTSIEDNKRLNDDELEAVSGGVTSQSVDPAVLAAQSIQSALNAALGVATGGAHPIDTPTAVDTGTHSNTSMPTITGQTHIAVSASDIFGGGSSTASDNPHPIAASPLTLTVTGTAIGGHHINAIPPGGINEQTPVMHVDQTPHQGTFTKLIPTVSAQNLDAPHPGGTYNIANREGMAFNLPSDK